jgi:hypothetical protein
MTAVSLITAQQKSSKFHFMHACTQLEFSLVYRESDSNTLGGIQNAEK